MNSLTDVNYLVNLLAFLVCKVRPFYMEDLVLSDTSLDPSAPDIVKKVEAYCSEKVETLIERAGWSME